MTPMFAVLMVLAQFPTTVHVPLVILATIVKFPFAMASMLPTRKCAPIAMVLALLLILAIVTPITLVIDANLPFALAHLLPTMQLALDMVIAFCQILVFAILLTLVIDAMCPFVSISLHPTLLALAPVMEIALLPILALAAMVGRVPNVTLCTVITKMAALVMVCAQHPTHALALSINTPMPIAVRPFALVLMPSKQQFALPMVIVFLTTLVHVLPVTLLLHVPLLFAMACLQPIPMFAVPMVHVPHQTIVFATATILV